MQCTERIIDRLATSLSSIFPWIPYSFHFISFHFIWDLHPLLVKKRGGSFRSGIPECDMSVHTTSSFDTTCEERGGGASSFFGFTFLIPLWWIPYYHCHLWPPPPTCKKRGGGTCRIVHSNGTCIPEFLIHFISFHFIWDLHPLLVK